MPKVVPEYKEEAKKRIIQNALKLFSERGYYKTRMIDIASSMGVSKGAIYQYFDSKQELLTAVLETHVKTRGQEVQTFLESGGLQAISTGEFFDKMLTLRLGTPPLSFDLLQEATKNEIIMEWIKTSSKKWINELVILINDLKKQGMIKKEVDSQSLARGLIALRDGLYSSLSLLDDQSRARKTWVDIMGLLMKQVLI